MLSLSFLLSYSRTLGSHIIRIKNSLRHQNYNPFASSFPKEEHLTENVLSIERVMRIAEMYNLLKPYKVFGLTARGAAVVSILTMSLSFYGIVFSFYSSSSTSSSSGLFGSRNW